MPVPAAGPRREPPSLLVFRGRHAYHESVFNVAMRGIMKLAALLSALALGVASLAVQAADPIIIKFSHVVAPDTPKGRAADYFK